MTPKHIDELIYNDGDDLIDAFRKLESAYESLFSEYNLLKEEKERS